MMKIFLFIVWMVAWVGCSYAIDCNIGFFIKYQSLVMLIGAVFGLISAAIWEL